MDIFSIVGQISNLSSEEHHSAIRQITNLSYVATYNKNARRAFSMKVVTR